VNPSLIFLAVLLLVCRGAASSWAAGKDGPWNVLWIVADDLGVELGCYGEPEVATPNIDRLAAEGMRYTNCFATSPVCSSSRTAFILGMYQTTVGGHHHLTRIKPVLEEGVRPVTEWFRGAGYFVSNGSSSSVTLQSGAGRAKVAPSARDKGDANLEVELGKGKVHYNFVCDEKRLFDGTDWRDRADPGQPFFGQVQIKEPHRAFVVVDDSVIDAAKVRVPPIYPEHPVTRADWRNYLASIQVLDEKVGVILERLEADGLSENTVVMFFGDHGRPHLWDKQWLYDGGLRVPLIVRWPGHLKAGDVDARLVSLIDLAAASLAVAGIEQPDRMQGEDFLAEDWIGRPAVYAARDRCGDAVDRIRAVRTGRYKYIRNYMPENPYMLMSGYKKGAYPVWTLMEVLEARGELEPGLRFRMMSKRPAEELYDVRSDPHEMQNLAGYPDHEKVLEELRQQLATWERETGDRGGEVEGDETYMRKLKSEKRGAFSRLMGKRGLEADVTPEYYLEWWEKELGVEE
jgi:N-sulfoglucosamine sulfohydrolase